MDQYKNQIEDIVVPIYISVRDKNALRRELWSHVVETATRLIDEGSIEKEAYEEAIARLGTPEEIRDAHHAELTTAARWMNWFDVWVYPYEKRTWNAATFGLGVMAIGLALSMIPFAMILTPIFSTQMTFEKAAVILSFYPSLGIWVFILVLVLTSLPRAQFELVSISGPGAMRRNVLRLWARSFVALPLMLIIVGINYLVLGSILGFESAKLLEFVYIAPAVFAFPWFATVFTLTVGMVREGQTCGAIPDWPYRYS